MQLGARWNAGGTPHRSVPPALYKAISEQESLHPSAGSWTLTWLEGLPRCELDSVALLTLDAAGLAILVSPAADEDDDWLN